MNKEQIAGQWQQFKGKVKAEFADLTDNDFELIQGKGEQFIGKVKEKYGDAKAAAAQKYVDEYNSTCGCGSSTGSCSSKTAA